MKIECTRQAFQKVFKHRDFVFTGIDVSSGVSSQPMSDRETYEGARNRAINLKNNYPDGDFWVDIEGGIESINQHMHAFAWMIVFD